MGGLLTILIVLCPLAIFGKAELIRLCPRTGTGGSARRFAAASSILLRLLLMTISSVNHLPSSLNKKTPKGLGVCSLTRLLLRCLPPKPK